MDNIDTTNMFKRKYKMRSVGDGGLNTVVSIPREVLQREADKRGIPLDEFLRTHRAVAQFNGIEGVYYTFEEFK